MALLMVLVASCSKDNDLKESVFISDPDDYNMPAYSEWGYNTFGVYYDRDIFISNNQEVPVKVIVNDSATVFLFNGTTNNYDYYYYSNNMTMSIVLKGFQPDSYLDLTSFNDSIIDLAIPGVSVYITKDTGQLNTKILSGKLHFKRVQNLFVDDEQKEVILSGTFDFKAQINNEPVTFSDGRFDVGVNEDNFYKL